MNRGREWRHAINDKKSSSSSSSTTSSPSDVSFSPPTPRSSTITSLASSPSDVDDESRSLLRQYSEEEAQSSSSPFLRNVLSNTILYSVQNQDFLNTKMILEHYQNDVDYDLRHHNWKGETALMIAAQKDDLPSLQLLLECGADVDQVDPDGNTALLHAVKHHSAHATLHLIRFGANFNHVNDEGYNALFYSMEHNVGELIFFDFLLRCGCDLHLRNVYGHSLLMHAIIHQQPQAVEELLIRGVSVDTRNLQLDSAYDVAQRYPCMLSLLEKLLPSADRDVLEL